jgi:hypothetical protein
LAARCAGECGDGAPAIAESATAAPNKHPQALIIFFLCPDRIRGSFVSVRSPSADEAIRSSVPCIRAAIRCAPATAAGDGADKLSLTTPLADRFSFIRYNRGFP